MAHNNEQKKIYEPLKKASIGRLQMHRIENSVGEALPDVIGINRNGTAFWLENKYLEEWPKRATTFPLASAFQRGQLGKLRMWRDWKGRSFVLLRVGKDFILLNPSHPLKEMNQAELMSIAALIVGKDEIIKYLESLK